MMTPENKPRSPIETLPLPEKVRERLSQNIRENRLLRQLLKLSAAVHQQNEAKAVANDR